MAHCGRLRSSIALATASFTRKTASGSGSMREENRPPALGMSTKRDWARKALSASVSSGHCPGRAGGATSLPCRSRQKPSPRSASRRSPLRPRWATSRRSSRLRSPEAASSSVHLGISTALRRFRKRTSVRPARTFNSGCGPREGCNGDQAAWVVSLGQTEVPAPIPRGGGQRGRAHNEAGGGSLYQPPFAGPVRWRVISIAAGAPRSHPSV